MLRPNEGPEGWYNEETGDWDKPKPRMSRTRQSAKQAGARFERLIADCLADHVNPDIDRRVKYGTNDRGDVGGLRAMGEPVAVECKDTAVVDLAGWAKQAELERGNADANAGITIHKRKGHGDPLDQWVTMTARDLIAIITGERPGDE